jgi:hypothetical protein
LISLRQYVGHVTALILNGAPEPDAVVPVGNLMAAIDRSNARDPNEVARAIENIPSEAVQRLFKSWQDTGGEGGTA